MSDNMLDHALQYAGNGWHVLPLNGKIPRTAHGVDDATTDPDVIRSWWRRWPAANIGARVDPRLLVLDIDPRNGGSPKGLDPAPTLICFSGRADGGIHLYYRRPAGELSASRLPKGVDLKLNGYCVVPPSIHPDSGQSYWWVEAPIVELPANLRERLRPQPSRLRLVPSGRFDSSGRGLLKTIAAHPVQGVNNALFWAACRADEQGILGGLADEMVELAVSLGESEHRARATVDSARGRCAQ